MEPSQAPPNLFELTGGGTRVTYSTTSIAGQPQLHYQNVNNGADLTFTGQQIDTQDVAIGQLVTVTLRPAVEGGGLLFTLLLPAIDPDKQNPQKERRFDTQGIVTRDDTGIDTIPVGGVHQTYHFVPLHGKARVVQF